MDRRILPVLMLLLSVQCTGTETENPAAPLISFQGTECKKELAIGTKGLPPPDAGRVASAASKVALFDTSYDGLQCIAWQKLDVDSYRFELGNFHGSCGIEWQGSASVARDGTVALHAINSDCRAAACGWCMYDWAFEVRGVPESEDAHLVISQVNDQGNSCDSSRAPDDVTIPTSSAEQGTVCRPTFRAATDVFGRTLDTPGTLHMPCDPAVATPCTGELSCGPLASADDLRCLARCSDDSDCTLPGILTCQAGTCRLARTW